MANFGSPPLLLARAAMLLAAMLPLAAQSLGLKAGFLPQDPAGTGSFRPESKRFTLGPTCEFRLPWSVSLAAEALYKRLGYSYAEAVTGGAIYQSRWRGNSLEFPLLVRRYLREGRTGVPFLSAGYALRAQTSSGYALIPASDGTVSRRDISGHSPVFSHGVVIAAGLDWKAAWLHVAPELRFTRYNRPANA